MSDKFIQFRFPCTDCLVRAACKNKPTEKDDLYIGNGKTCLTLPKLNHKSYHKMLIECWANFGFDLLDNVQKREEPAGVNKDNNIPSGYVRAMHQMASTLQYMVNSTSWSEGKLFPFDKYEINEKLKIGSI